MIPSVASQREVVNTFVHTQMITQTLAPTGANTSPVNRMAYGFTPGAFHSDSWSCDCNVAGDRHQRFRAPNAVSTRNKRGTKFRLQGLRREQKMEKKSAPLTHWESLILVFACVLVLVLVLTYVDKVLGNIDNTPSGRSCKDVPCVAG